MIMLIIFHPLLHHLHFYHHFKIFPSGLQLQRAPDVTVKTKNDAATNTTQTMSSDRLIGELEQVIEKEKPNADLVPEDNIVFALPKILEILDNKDFE